MNTFKTLLYMGSMHGFFTFYLPYQLALADEPFYNFGIFRYFALPLWVIGILIIAWCSMDFIRKGNGTPAHVDPPKLLVINRLYRYVRNPIYAAALLVQLGYILWFASSLIILYFLSAFLTFHVLVVFIEEPILRNTFGTTYNEYCTDVPRWIPRINKVR
jgi:protein-S-isoprenylcysteine O-methyltransferase Ste14